MKNKLFSLLFAIVANTSTIFAIGGTCGENLFWDLTNGVLTISGSGTMTNYYNYGGKSPWYEYRQTITSLSLSKALTSIGNCAFMDCSGLTAVTIPNSVISIGNYAFNHCDSLTSVTIPNSVTSIGNWAFAYCSGLTSVTIPNSVTSVDAWVFAYCSGLTSVTIPNSVTSIGNNAFRNCSGLTSVTIPNSVTNIGEDAFDDCTNLSIITNYAVTPQQINEYTFYGVNKNTCKLYVLEEAVPLYKSATGWRDFLYIEAIQQEEGIENTTIYAQQGKKTIHDGQVVINRGDKTYTLTGQTLK